MNNRFSFDGCLICEAVKNADQDGKNLTESELLQAFKAQEDKQQSERKIQPATAAAQKGSHTKTL